MSAAADRTPTPDGARIMAHIEALAAISESSAGLTRRYLTPQHRRANDQVAAWMQDAGMTVREDAVGNVIGRYAGDDADAPALMIGSHLDTVIMAGKYDGMLGVVTAIECVRTLHARGVRLPFAIEVIGFCDEEGARFHSTYLGSRAVAGTFEPSLLERQDDDGIRMAEAMVAFGLDPGRVAEAARPADELLGYLELHIEQGPVLDKQGLASAVVTAIAGATRWVVTVAGAAGHAGTVPMALRRDALTAAAECALAVEDVARSFDATVGTVGRFAVAPGASNVIPGTVEFSVDLRAAEDRRRSELSAEIERRWREIATRRRVEIDIETVHEASSVACAPRLRRQIAAAIAREQGDIVELPSGAGHDAAAMAALTDVGMIFVRCHGGVSHDPDERIAAADAEAGARILLDVIEHFDPTG